MLNNDNNNDGKAPNCSTVPSVNPWHAKLLGVSPTIKINNPPGDRPVRYAFTFQNMDNEEKKATITVILNKENVHQLQAQLRKAQELVLTIQEMN